MTIRTFDEADNLKTGDLVYRYQDTLIFHAWSDLPDLDMPGLKARELDGEEIAVVVTAQITGRSFQAFWLPSPARAEDVPSSGTQIRSETVARRLFPTLIDYQFKGK